MDLKVRLTFTEELLGTASNNPNVHEDFIASKSNDTKKTKEEIAAIPAEKKIEETKTVFSRDENGNPILWDYQIKGFFKDSTSVLRTVKGTESSKVKAFKKYIDGRIFVFPRKITIHTDEPIGNCQRPLRASTAQGERIALSHSETVAAGSYIDCTIQLLSDDDEKWIRELLDYGKLRGLGQWRNSGKGRFDVEYIDS